MPLSLGVIYFGRTTDRGMKMIETPMAGGQPKTVQRTYEFVPKHPPKQTLGYKTPNQFEDEIGCQLALENRFPGVHQSWAIAPLDDELAKLRSDAIEHLNS